MKHFARLAMLASIANYRAQGETALSNLYGAGDEDFDGPANATSYVDRSTLQAMGVGNISTQARTISLSVANNTDKVAQAVLFGSYANLNAANYGNPVGITVTSGTVPYGQLLAQVQSNPMRFQGLRLAVGGQAPSVQLTEILKLNHNDATGLSSSAPYDPSLHLSPYQQMVGLIEDKDFDFIAAGDSSITFNVQPGCTAKFIFNLGAQTDVARVLNGKSALEVGSVKGVSTSPQLVLAAPASNFNGGRR